MKVTIEAEGLHVEAEVSSDIALEAADLLIRNEHNKKHAQTLLSALKDACYGQRVKISKMSPGETPDAPWVMGPPGDASGHNIKFATGEAESPFKDQGNDWWVIKDGKARPSSELLAKCIVYLTEHMNIPMTARRLYRGVTDEKELPSPAHGRALARDIRALKEVTNTKVIKVTTAKDVDKRKKMLAFEYTGIGMPKTPRAKKASLGPAPMSPTNFSEEDNCWMHGEPGETPEPTDALVDACIDWVKIPRSIERRLNSAQIYEGVTGHELGLLRADALAAAIEAKAKNRKVGIDVQTKDSGNVPRYYRFSIKKKGGRR